ncbi:MAG: WhiB family transcriptional regulator [[Mycobacterium] stephanolepidis]
MSSIDQARTAATASEDWRATGVCAQVGGDTWFPDRGGSTSDAKRVCRGCPVKGECLEWALVNDERFGVWGGLSERERRALRRKQA